MLALLLVFLILLIYFAATTDNPRSLTTFLLTISYIIVTLVYLIVFLRHRS